VRILLKCRSGAIPNETARKQRMVNSAQSSTCANYRKGVVWQDSEDTGDEMRALGMAQYCFVLRF
jgi:hypothetical protein